MTYRFRIVGDTGGSFNYTTSELRKHDWCKRDELPRWLMPKALCLTGLVVAGLVFLLFFIDLLFGLIGLQSYALFKLVSWWMDTALSSPPWDLILGLVRFSRTEVA